MANPRFSILIPVYNVEKYLEDCLNSVINQTYKDFEVICVEDGSTDNSPKILEEFAKKDSRIKVVKHDGNKGLLAGRVTGVNNASGDYYFFLDSDDSIHERALEIFDKEISKDPVQILLCNFDLNYTEEVGFIERRSASLHFNIKNKRLFGEKIFFDCFKKKKHPHSVICKVMTSELCKKVYSQVMDDNIVMGEDLYAYFMMSYYAKTFRSINKKLYKYNLGRGVTGGKKFSFGLFKKYCKMGDFFQDLEKFLERENASTKHKKLLAKIKNNYCDMLVHDYLYYAPEEDKEEAKNLLVKSYGEGEVLEDGFTANIQKSITYNQKIGKRPENAWGKFRRKIRKDGFFYTCWWAVKMLFKIK